MFGDIYSFKWLCICFNNSGKFLRSPTSATTKYCGLKVIIMKVMINKLKKEENNI